MTCSCTALCLTKATVSGEIDISVSSVMNLYLLLFVKPDTMVFALYHQRR